MTQTEQRRLASENLRLEAKVEQLANDLSQALQNNRDLYRERDRWRGNAMSAFAALEETRAMLRTAPPRRRK